MAARWEAADQSRCRRRSPRLGVRPGPSSRALSTTCGASRSAPQPGGAVAQQPRVVVGGVEQVVQEFAAHALLGLGWRSGGPAAAATVTMAARSRVRWSTGSRPGWPCSTSAPSSSPPAATAATQLVAVAARRARRLRERADGRAAAGARPSSSNSTRAAEHFGDGGGHVVDAAAAQHEFGEPVVDVGGALDDALRSRIISLAVASSARAARVSASRRAVSMATAAWAANEPSSATCSRSKTRARRSAREQDADDVAAAEQQRHAEDRDQPLLADAASRWCGCAGSACPRSSSSVTYGRAVWATRPPSPSPMPQPQLLEAGGDRAVGDPHVGVAALGVVQGQVGDLGAEQRAGALHDRRSTASRSRSPARSCGGLEERGQLGLAAPAALQLGADPQREQLARAPSAASSLGRTLRRAGAQQRPLVRLGGRARARSSR